MPECNREKRKFPFWVQFWRWVRTEMVRLFCVEPDLRLLSCESTWYGVRQKIHLGSERCTAVSSTYSRRSGAMHVPVLSQEPALNVVTVMTMLFIFFNNLIFFNGYPKNSHWSYSRKLVYCIVSVSVRESCSDNVSQLWRTLSYIKRRSTSICHICQSDKETSLSEYPKITLIPAKI